VTGVQTCALPIYDADAHERLDLIGGELTRVNGLLNGLLDQARLQPEAATQVNLAACAAEVLALARYQVADGITLRQDIPAELVCRLPENRLRQALLNLVLNAAQVLPQGGNVQVTAHLDDGALQLEVGDDGPGFPDALLHSGVHPFASARSGGTGLGLASVRRLALDLGGAIRLANQPPHGARFTLILPCGSCEASQ
jgi:signal transduction histidine kinase